jgi:hypothetical protein
VLTVSQAIIAAQGLKTTARSGKVLVLSGMWLELPRWVSPAA